MWCMIVHVHIYDKLPLNSAVIGCTIERTLHIFAHLSTEITHTSLMLSAPYVKFVKHLITKTGEAT